MKDVGRDWPFGNVGEPDLYPVCTRPCVTFQDFDFREVKRGFLFGFDESKGLARLDSWVGWTRPMSHTNAQKTQKYAKEYSC